MGRKRAAWIVLILFMGALIFTCIDLYGVAQEAVAKLQLQGKLTMQGIKKLTEEVLKDSGGVVVGLFLVFLIYLLAPIELVFSEILRAFFPQTPDDRNEAVSSPHSGDALSSPPSPSWPPTSSSRQSHEPSRDDAVPPQT